MQVIFGTMTIGGQVDREQARSMIDTYFNFCSKVGQTPQLDTAHVYQNGLTETILGEILTEEEKRNVLIDTKANPWEEPQNMEPENIKKQLNDSLERLKMDKVNIFYLHGPHRDTPIFETLKACNELYEEGKFQELGISNYSAWEVVEMFYICTAEGWVKPTVYQGLYNVLSRSPENELFPALKKLGIRFYIFNVLAGGLLTGKYSEKEEPTEGRFFEYKHIYTARYWHPSVFTALEQLNEDLRETGTLMTNASIRWLKHHTTLVETDGFIFGQSKLEQLEQALSAFEEDELSDDLVSQMNALWNITQTDAPLYFKKDGGMK